MPSGEMVPARLFEQVGQRDKVRCLLCPHSCLIDSGDAGLCHVRQNKAGTLFSTIYGKVTSSLIDAIERRPFFHFWPGSLTLTVSSVGCNLSCSYCQNWQISQAPGEKLQIPHSYYPPSDLVALAEKNHCQSITFACNEPTVWFEYVLDVASKARERGVRTALVTNGYMSLAAADLISKVVDAVNIDVKAFSDQFYRRTCGAPSKKPVLDVIQRFFENKTHLELSYLLVPEKNDKITDIRALSEWIHDSLGDLVPLHLNAFFPAFRMLNTAQTSPDLIEAAFKIARSTGLLYVYSGSLRGSPHENTFCPSCGLELIHRQDCEITQYNVQADKKCPKCQQTISITGEHETQRIPWRKGYF